MRVVFKDSCCDGTEVSPNEDAVGWTGTPEHGAAWVIDGATGVGEREWLPQWGSDARWYAQRLNQTLTALSLQSGAPTQLFRAVLDRMADAYCAESAAEDIGQVPRYALPSAAAAWVRWHNGEALTFAALGDCKALVRSKGRDATLLGRRTAVTSDDRVNRAVRRLQAEGLSDPAAYRDRLAGQLRANRARMNTPGGYWVFSLHPEAAEHLDLDDRRIEAPATVILMTDGFFRLVDTYAVYDLDDLVDAVEDRGLAPQLATLREVEHADPDCLRYPRLKPTDDATALVLTVSPG